jgi:hypothetical protein
MGGSYPLCLVRKQGFVKDLVEARLVHRPRTHCGLFLWFMCDGSYQGVSNCQPLLDNQCVLGGLKMDD